MKRLEYKWAKILGKEPPADINVSIEVQYGAGARPTGFVVQQIVDGKVLDPVTFLQ